MMMTLWPFDHCMKLHRKGSIPSKGQTSMAWSGVSPLSMMVNGQIDLFGSGFAGLGENR